MKINKAFITILSKYTDFAKVFSPDPVAKLPEYTGINNHAINLIDGKQPFYKLIYSPKLVESEILKTYIEINLANGFIRSSKSFTNTPIFFIWKPNGCFQLYVDY